MKLEKLPLNNVKNELSRNKKIVFQPNIYPVQRQNEKFPYQPTDTSIGVYIFVKEIVYDHAKEVRP